MKRDRKTVCWALYRERHTPRVRFWEDRKHGKRKALMLGFDSVLDSEEHHLGSRYFWCLRKIAFEQSMQHKKEAGTAIRRASCVFGGHSPSFEAREGRREERRIVSCALYM